MPVLLFLNNIDGKIAKVATIHYAPETLSEEEKRGGVLIDSYNEPTPQPGKIALPYFNYETQEVFFEYINAPITDGERIRRLEERLSEMEIALSKLAVQ